MEFDENEKACTIYFAGSSLSMADQWQINGRSMADQDTQTQFSRPFRTWGLRIQEQQCIEGADLACGSAEMLRKLAGEPEEEGESSMRCRHPTPARTMFFATCVPHQARSEGGGMASLAQAVRRDCSALCCRMLSSEFWRW